MTTVTSLSINELKRKLLRLDNLEEDTNIKKREAGLDWPKEAETMIGLNRMNNLWFCVEQVVKNNIPGDLIETGVWRGGACIFMRGILKSMDDSRKVYVADSFKGFPSFSELAFDVDKGSLILEREELRISRNEVEENFKKYDMLDNQVVFLEGWFKDTLPKVEGPFALLRLDGDLYESTLDALENLYHKLSIGGYIIIDDYNDIEACKLAVINFRRSRKIIEEMILVDHTAVFWKKERE